MTVSRVSAGRAELETRSHYLYRFFDRAGVLLYVGITVDFNKRKQQHARYKSWWPRVDHDATQIEHYNGQRAVLDAEREAIENEKPLENDRYNQWVEVDSEEAGCACGGGDLPAVVYDYLSDTECQEILKTVNGTPLDERVYEQESPEFVRVAFTKVVENRLDLEAAVNDLVKALPKDLVNRCVRSARTEMREHMGDAFTKYELMGQAIRHIGAEMGRHFEVSA